MSDSGRSDDERSLMQDLADLAVRQARPETHHGRGPSVVIGLGCDLAAPDPYVWAIVRLVDGVRVGVFVSIRADEPGSDPIADLGIVLAETQDLLNGERLRSLEPRIQQQTDRRGVIWLVPDGVAPWDSNHF